MRRTLVISTTPLLAFGLAAVTSETTADSGPKLVEVAAVEAAPTTIVELVATLGDSITPASAVQLRQGVRDLLHHTIDRLEGWIDSLGAQSGIAIPDLSVLAVDPIENVSSSGFGWREDPFGRHAKFHHGADFRGKHGTPVVSAGDGVVTFAGHHEGYGNVVFVDHGGGVVTRYAHLRKIETKLHAPITAGQRLGQVGSTGRTTGPHLHFEVRLDGRSVDPITAMAVAQLVRESPTAGRIAAHTLAPEVQGKKQSDVDPPKRAKRDPKRESRPERSGFQKREKPLS